MAPEVKNNESQDSKIKGMLADKKLTPSERSKIVEMLDAKKEERKQQIKSETLSDLKNFLSKAQGGVNFEKFKKDMLPKIDERLGEVKIDKSKQPYEVIENPIYMEVTTPKPEETKTEEKTPAPVFKEVPFNLKTQLESNKKVVVAEYTTTSGSPTGDEKYTNSFEVYKDGDKYALKMNGSGSFVDEKEIFKDVPPGVVPTIEQIKAKVEEMKKAQMIKGEKWAATSKKFDIDVKYSL